MTSSISPFRRSTSLLALHSLCLVVFFLAVSSSSSLLVAASEPASNDQMEVFPADSASVPPSATLAPVSSPSHSMPPLMFTKEKAKILADNEIAVTRETTDAQRRQHQLSERILTTSLLFVLLLSLSSLSQPQLVPAAPSSITKLSWGAALRVHDLGAVLTPSAVHERPRINYNIHANRFYTVVLLDMDAPSRAHPIAAQWLHWLVINVPGRDLSRGDTIAEYAGPTPPQGTGQHRYVVLVYEQTKKILPEDQVRIARDSQNGRAKWHLERYLAANDAGAKLVSINFFLAEYEEQQTAV